MRRPSYGQLRRAPIAGLPVAWGLFGDQDQLGTVNQLEREQVLAAASGVVDGRVHPLNWDVCLPDPHPFRPTPVRRQRTRGPLIRDDVIDALHLQYSTQWDGLRHIAIEDGFYNAVPAHEVDAPDNDVLGMQAWAQRGIVGRGVLVDVAGLFALEQRAYEPSSSHEIGVGDLDRALIRQGTQIHQGDIVLVRTGWIEWYESLGVAARHRLGRDMQAAGLQRAPEMAAWFWNHGVAAVAADNPAIEAMPLPDDHPNGSLHAALIAGLGMPYGELFDLTGLARSCDEVGQYTFLFVSAPMNLRGGVGSPGNAMAIV